MRAYYMNTEIILEYWPQVTQKKQDDVVDKEGELW